MLSSLSGSVTPVAGDQVVLIALVVSISMTIVLSALKLPVSFSMAIVGAFAGAAYGSSLPLNVPRLEDIVAFWFLSPILAAVLAYAFYRIILSPPPGSACSRSTGRAGTAVILTSLIIAYVLGANNIGLIYGMSLNGSPASQTLPLLLVVVSIVGMVALGRGGISGTVGDRLLGLSPFGVVATFLASAVLIWTGTQLAIPISISQCLLGGMFGAAFTKQISAINTRLATESIAMWWWSRSARS